MPFNPERVRQPPNPFRVRILYCRLTQGCRKLQPGAEIGQRLRRYSFRSATSGSTFLAGRYDASSATNPKPTQTTINVGKSVGATPNNKLFINRVNANAHTAPSRMPTIASHKAFPITSLKILRTRAPNAIRISVHLSLREREHSNYRKTRSLDQAPHCKSNVFDYRNPFCAFCAFCGFTHTAAPRVDRLSSLYAPAGNTPPAPPPTTAPAQE
jgi:hypothetical protein